MVFPNILLVLDGYLINKQKYIRENWEAWGGRKKKLRIEEKEHMVGKNLWRTFSNWTWKGFQVRWNSIQPC